MHKVFTSQFATRLSGSYWIFFREIYKSIWLVPFAVGHFSPV